MNDDDSTQAQQGNSAEDEAALSAGFDEEFAETATAGNAQAADATTDDTGTQAQATTSTEAAPAAPEEPPAAPHYIQITSEQWEANQRQQADLVAELARLRDSTAGSLGGLKQALTQVQTGADLSGDDFAGLRALGLDDVADSLAKDLSAAFKKVPRVAGGGEAVDPVEIARQVEYQLGVKGLQRLHPDFAQVRESDEFKSFIASKPEERQAEFWQTLDPTVASGYFTEFKSAKQKAADAATRAATQAASRRNRFAAAETPRGVGADPMRGTSKSAIDEFQEGFATG